MPAPAPPALDEAAEERLRAYGGRVEAAFAEAARRAGGARTRTLALAGRRIALSFAGAEAGLEERLLPALSHLPESPGAPDLRVLLWDEAGTGVPLPPPGWAFAGSVVRGQVAGLTGRTVLTALEPAYGGFSLYDRERRLALFHAPDARLVPGFESSFPLRTVLSWFFADAGLRVVHAGAVGTADGAALLVGRGGSGKSGTSLACLCAGMRFAGDDYCLVDPDLPPRVHGLFSSAKLFPEDAAHYPALAPARRWRAEEAPEKDLYFLREAFGDRLAATMPLRAILLPRVGGDGPPRFTPVSAAAALAAMAPSTLFQLPGTGAEAFGAMADLARRLPAYRLDLGAPRDAVPAAIARFLGELAAP